MNCEWVKENATLYLYNELADDAKHELEQHLERCTDCAGEIDEVRQFQSTMNALPRIEVTPNMLASARMSLQEALETAEQKRGWLALAFDPMHWLQQIRFSPALAVALLLVGFGSGIGTMYRMASHGSPIVVQGIVPERHTESSIVGIRGITQEPGSDKVQIQYETSLPEKAQGSINDPKIQELLLMASRSNFNSGVRIDSVDLLNKRADDPQVREALIYALRYDSNPGVRLKAMEGLSGLVKQDIRVRNAVLEALLNDNNPGVRTGAIRALEAVKADTSVRQALQQLAQEDPSTYVRTESKRLLASMPHID